MKKYKLSEIQVKKLLNKIIQEQAAVPQVTTKTMGTTTPTTGVNIPSTTTPGEPGDMEDLSTTPATGTDAAPIDGDTPLPPEDGDPLAAADGGGVATSTGAFDDGGAGATSNAKMHKWDSGASRGKANPIGNSSWESGIVRGAANQLGNSKWEDVVGVSTSRGRANELMENKKKKKKK